jgi:ribonuclease J
MSFNIKKHRDDLLFVPMGGAGEIGINLNLYYYEGKWLIVDFGLGFAGDSCPGVDVIVPDITFLVKNKQNIAGIVLTHAHEDHIGALQYLWEELECKIYTTKFTATVVKAKFHNAGIAIKDEQLIILNTAQAINIGPFNIELVGLTHSIPDNHAVFIRTENGNIFHSGDWKFDDTPLVGETSNIEQLERLSKEGVNVLVSDSTNIFSEGFSGSEGDLQESLTSLIAGYQKSMVVVTTFASNIARIYSLAKAAEACGRKVILVGRALWRMYEAALDCGYLQDLKPFLHDKNFASHDRRKLMVIASGCQAEPLAAANKIANNDHPHIKIAANDVVIFSSKIIPGNEKRIYELMNKYCKLGVEVMTEKDHFVHVSGHPARGEMARLYEILKPKVSIPVHGEAMHLHAHAKFALAQNGVEQALEAEDGMVIKIADNEAIPVGHVETGYLGVDGNSLISSNSCILRDRRIMRDNGIIFVTILVNNKGELLKEPKVIAPGMFDPLKDDEYIISLRKEIVNNINNLAKSTKEGIEKSASSTTLKFIRREFAKHPKVIVIVEVL